MATQTGFARAEIAEKPQIVCLGRIEEVPDAKVTQDGKGDYYNIRIKLAGEGGSPGVTHNFLYRADWFTPGFDPKKLRDLVNAAGEEIGPKIYDQYRRNVNGPQSSISTLQGMCGSEEGFQEFDTKRVLAFAEVQKAGRSEFTAQEIRDLLKDFLLNDHEGQTLGYKLKQRSDKVSVNENGKGVYELQDGYELGAYFYPTDEAIKRFVSAVEKSKGKLIMGFETE